MSPPEVLGGLGEGCPLKLRGDSSGKVHTLLVLIPRWLLSPPGLAMRVVVAMVVEDEQIFPLVS